MGPAMPFWKNTSNVCATFCVNPIWRTPCLLFLLWLIFLTDRWKMKRRLKPKNSDQKVIRWYFSKSRTNARRVNVLSATSWFQGRNQHSSGFFVAHYHHVPFKNILQLQHKILNGRDGSSSGWEWETERQRDFEKTEDYRRGRYISSLLQERSYHVGLKWSQP